MAQYGKKKSLKNKQVCNEFLERYSWLIIEKFHPKAKVFKTFIKVEIAGKEYDYHPGAPFKQPMIIDGYGRMQGPPLKWSNVSHKEFLALLQIDPNYDVFSSREEDIAFRELGLFNDDQI